MDVVWWALIVLSFIISFIGIIFPIIPGLFMIWIGVLIYHFLITPLVGLNFWITFVILSILTLTIDYIASSAWVKKNGGSKAAVWSAVGGILIGPFIFGPIGIIIGPFIFVLVTELIRGNSFDKAFKIGFASFIGLLGGAIIKIILHLALIGIFLYAVFV